MLSFLKVFGQGVLCVVLSPLIVLILALYSIYCVLVFTYIAIRSIIVFFMGGTPLGDLPEDVEAKRVLMEKNKTEEDAKRALAAMYQQQVPVFTANVNPISNSTEIIETNSHELQEEQTDVSLESDVIEEDNNDD